MEKRTIYGLLCIIVVVYGCISRQTMKFSDASDSKKGQITFSGGSGDSYETAIIIKGTQKIKKPENAVAAEYEYISGLYGKKDKDWSVEEQSMVQENDKIFDMIRVKISSNGKMHFFYFDITYFSKKPKSSDPATTEPDKQL